MISSIRPPFQFKIQFNRFTIFFFAFIISILSWVCSACGAQITLAWDANDPTPEGYQVFQRTGASDYDYTNPAWPIDGNDHTEANCTITNLTPGTTYYFVVRAYVGTDQSGDSNEISYTVPSGVTLSSIAISGPIQVTENNTSQYTSTATYSDGSTAALTSGVTWGENSSATTISSRGLLTAANVTSDTAVTITASYGGKSDTHSVTVKNIAPTLSSIAISGPIQVTENNTSQYTCTATYSDGSTAALTSGVTWSENSSATTISSRGLLTSANVTSDTAVTITASYGGKIDTHSVTVKKTAASLSSLTISGPAQVNEQSSAQYACKAHYSDGSTSIVSDSVNWSLSPGFATINTAGYLISGTVQNDEQVTVTASIDGKTANFNLTINNSKNNYALNVDILGSGTVLLDPPGGVYDEGTVVTLTAQADLGWAFDGWIGSVSDADAQITSVMVDSDITLSLTFLEDTDLDSVPDREEWGSQSQDNTFDGNNDGIADYLQGNVASIHTKDHLHILTISVPEPARIKTCATKDIESIPDGLTEGILPLGLIAFDIENIVTGEATTLTIQLPEGFEFDTFFKYGPTPDNPLPHWYEFTYGQTSETGAEFQGDTVKLYLKDGQRGDDDLSSNGVISDLGGPVILSSDDITDPNPPNNQQGNSDTITGAGSSSSGCFIDSIATHLF